MNHHTPGDNLSVINRSNLHANHYTKSLIQEALRVHLFTPAEVDDLHMQIMGQLEQLLRNTETDDAGQAVDRQQDASALLQGIFFSLDTALLAHHDPMYALAQLQTGSVTELYYTGRKLLKSHYYETVALWVRVKHTASPYVPDVYTHTVQNEIRTVLRQWDPQRCDQTPPQYTYPLADEAWQNGNGIFATKNYLLALLAENRFCAHFPDPPAPADSPNLFSRYAVPVMIRAALGRFPTPAPLREEEHRALKYRLKKRRPNEVRMLFCSTIPSLLHDLYGAQCTPKDAQYCKHYALQLSERLMQHLASEQV